MKGNETAGTALQAPTLVARRRITRVAHAALGLCLGVLLAEALVRGFSLIDSPSGRRIASRDPFEFIYEPFGNFGYRERPGKSERYTNGTRAHFNALAYRGPLVSYEKPPQTYRIVLLGGSTTFGFGVNDEDTIDAYMRTLLRGTRAGVCFEVVNLALGGYDSYQDYERMRVDGLRFSPDLVIINSGINDVRNALFGGLTEPPDPRTLLWEPVMKTMREEAEHGYRLSTLAQHYSYLARIPGYVQEIWGQRKAIASIQVTEPDGSAVDYFATNLLRTADLVFGVRAALILSTPPSALGIRNKPSDPPEKSYWIRDAGTTEEYRKRLAVRMKEISGELLRAGHPVVYISHELQHEHFLDDAHLTASGNRRVAEGLIAAAQPFMPNPGDDGSAVEFPCP